MRQLKNLKKNPLNESEKIFRHNFTISMIKLSLDLYGKAAIGYRKVARVLEVFFENISEKVPHHSTVRLWVMRNGYYCLNKPIEKADDWVAIGDVTIDLGKVKCLTILGVRMSHLECREDYTLNFCDVEILGLHLTQKCTGEFVYNALEETRERVGDDILAVVIDEGADVKKGARLFQEKHNKTQILHDMPHKLSLVMKWALTNDAIWSDFLKKLLETRRLIQQTELTALMPGNQRSKGRYMDVGYLVKWPRRILERRASGNLDSIPENRFRKYFGWISDFWDSIINWEFMVEAVDLIKGIVRQMGLSFDIYESLKMVFDEASTIIENEQLTTFLSKSIGTVQEEYEKLAEGEKIICSTEVLESAFGKFKEITSGYQGITGNVLGMATYLGADNTEEDIKQAMETCSVQSATTWVKEKVGKTVGSYRYEYFRKNKGHNLAN